MRSWVVEQVGVSRSLLAVRYALSWSDNELLLVSVELSGDDSMTPARR